MAPRNLISISLILLVLSACSPNDYFVKMNVERCRRMCSSVNAEIFTVHAEDGESCTCGFSIDGVPQ
jgi:hypothetical protein